MKEEHKRIPKIDFHTHVGNDHDGLGATYDCLARTMAEAGVVGAAVFPFNEVNGALIAESIRLLETRPEWAFPFLRFNPRTTSPEQLEALLRENAFYGVKLHPRSQNFDGASSDFFPHYEVVQASGLPLIFHTRKNDHYSDPDRIVTIARNFGGLKLVLGHFADLSIPAIKEMRDHPEVYLETSLFGVSPYNVKCVANLVGADRLLYGSDAPYGDQEIEAMQITKARIPDADKEKILYGNAARLLGLER